MHYNEKFSAFLNHELPKEERQAIAEHLLQCESCRNEHDQIKLGAALAGQLPRADAPENLWNEIKNNLDGQEEHRKTSRIPQFSFFSAPGLIRAAAGLLIICGLVSAVYFGFLRKNSTEIVEKTEPDVNQSSNARIPPALSTPGEVLTNQNANPQISSNGQNQTANANLNYQANPNSNSKTLPRVNPTAPVNPPDEPLIAQNNLPSWNVETISGTPKAGNQTVGEKGKLTVGEFLETDANSRARVQVANIGQVEIAPNSRVKFINTRSTEHRLSLERGELKAKILAPPRLFIVDTPSAVAVDLGCEYTLEVDREGNTRLHVTAGFVALERDGRESIVPAGAICLTKKGKGLGTPFSEESSPEFQAALIKFDFAGGGSDSLQTIIKDANLFDSLTLWHLLSRVPKNEQGKVFDALARQIPPPAGVTREGVLKLNKKMLDAWWSEIENVWFG